MLSATLVRCAKDVGVDIQTASNMQQIVNQTYNFLSEKSDQRLADIGVDFSSVEWAFFLFFAETIDLHDIGDTDSNSRAKYFRSHIPSRQPHLLSDDLRAALVTSQQFSVCARAILHEPLCASADMISYLCFLMAGTIITRMKSAGDDKVLLSPLLCNIDNVLTLAKRDFPASTGIDVLSLSVHTMVETLRL